MQKKMIGLIGNPSMLPKSADSTTEWFLTKDRKPRLHAIREAHP